MEEYINNTILVIDDNQTKFEILKEHFKTRFNVVITNQNGTTAMEQIEKLYPKIIITDWVLTEFDGFTLMDKIKHIFGYKPIIIVTSIMSNEVFVEKSLSMGAS